METLDGLESGVGWREGGGALDRQQSGGVFDGEGVLDRQESGGFLNGVVLYCFSQSSTMAWQSAARSSASNGARSTDRSPESFRSVLKSLGRIVLLSTCR